MVNHFLKIVCLTISGSYALKGCITAQKMKFSIKALFSICDQIRKKSWIWSHLLKKSLMENFIFNAEIRVRENLYFGIIYPVLGILKILHERNSHCKKHEVLHLGFL